MPIPKGCRWGVDSFVRLDRITDGKKSLFEFVVEKTKEVPDFWGRYLGKAVNGESRLQKEEINFLRRFSPGTRVVLIFNGIFNPVESKPRANPAEERRQGKADALAAIGAATEVGAPAGVVIYANVEPRHGKVSSNWIRGWWEGMLASKFGPGGIYGNTSDETGHIGFIGKAYKEALREMPPGFDPPLWAALPIKGRKTPREINFDYEAGEPPGVHGAARVWQYGVNWFPFDPRAEPPVGRFDTDLATKHGFDAMWKLTPLPAQRSPHEREHIDLEEELL